LTCASCHASVEERGALLYGVPNHRIDLGKARDDYTGTMSLYSTWGRGRVDIAADGKDNPVVIADVRVARYQRYLHRTANIRSSLEALALRLETGLIVAHRKVVRPDRKAAFSLAYYLWTLGDKFDPERSLRHSGRPVFERHCASCHQGPSHSGKPIPPAVIDSPVAKMGGAARGTGKVRIPSLLGVSDRKRLLFGGEAAGIDGLLDPGRQEGGHFVGASLSAGERSAIRDYLSEL
jgi:mono/diheme cytochrome c family protein